jgi:hypothetical protein
MIELLLILVMSVGSLSKREVVIDCDLIEINHRTGNGTDLKQIVFYERSPDYRRYNVITWCLQEHARGPFMSGGRTAYSFYHWESKKLLTFRARLVRNTETRHDPERENGKVHDDMFRLRIEGK